jgi:cytochrome c-type biogenesis protein CcmH/NrfG
MDPEEKIRRLEAMAAEDPADALTWFMLGSERLRVRLDAGAAEAFRRSRALKPEQPAAARLLGDALRRSNRLDEARAAYEAAVRLAEATGDLQVAKEARVFLARLK